MSKRIGLLVLKDKDTASNKTNRILEFREKYGTIPVVVTYGHLCKLFVSGKVFNSNDPESGIMK